MLGIRPVWHQRADRAEAHILVCFLAYGLWKPLEHCQRRAGHGQSPRRIVEELKRIQSTDVVLPTEEGRELRRRRVVRPGPLELRKFGPARHDLAPAPRARPSTDGGGRRRIGAVPGWRPA